MILVSDIKERLLAALDAEGVDYYRDNEDIIPSINSAVDWVISVVNKTREEKKITNEVFKELRVAKVFQTSTLSRVSIDDDFWTLDAVVPLPNTYPDSSILVNPNPLNSILRDDLIHIDGKSATRLTSEEFGLNISNPFKPGNEVEECKSLISYCYLDPMSYNDNSAGQEYFIDIRPRIPTQLVTIIYVKNPTKVTDISDTIPFSQNLFGLIWEKALQFLSFQEGDKTSIYLVSERDILRLINTLS
jgi:hypothetical protein